MNKVDDDAIEALLRREFEGPVADEGFSDRTMRQLPPRRRRKAWALWAGILVGTVACWLSLLSTPLPNTGWRDWMNGDMSPSAITLLVAIASMSLLACWWGAMEADDH
jgi:hypothetical protein